MDSYRITIKRPDGHQYKYVTKWKDARSMKQLRKFVLSSLEGTNWELVSIYYERPATYIPPEYPRRNNKKY